MVDKDIEWEQNKVGSKRDVSSTFGRERTENPYCPLE